MTENPAFINYGLPLNRSETIGYQLHVTLRPRPGLPIPRIGEDLIKVLETEGEDASRPSLTRTQNGGIIIRETGFRYADGRPSPIFTFYFDPEGKLTQLDSWDNGLQGSRKFEYDDRGRLAHETSTTSIGSVLTHVLDTKYNYTEGKPDMEYSETFYNFPSEHTGTITHEQREQMKVTL